MTLRLKTRENQRVFVCRELSTDVILHPYYPECYWGWDKVTSWLLFVFHVPSFPATQKTGNPYYMSTNTHFQQFLFIYSISFESLAALYLKLANTSFLVAKRRSPPPSWSVQSSCFNHDCFNAPVYRSRLQHLEHWCFLFFLVTQRTAPPQTPPSPSSQLFLHPWQWREAPGPWLNPGVV